MNIPTVSQRFRSMQCFIREIFEEMFYSMATPCLCPYDWHKYGGPNLTKTRHRVCYKKPVVVL